MTLRHSRNLSLLLSIIILFAVFCAAGASRAAGPYSDNPYDSGISSQDTYDGSSYGNDTYGSNAYDGGTYDGTSYGSGYYDTGNGTSYDNNPGANGSYVNDPYAVQTYDPGMYPTDPYAADGYGVNTNGTRQNEPSYDARDSGRASKNPAVVREREGLRKDRYKQQRPLEPGERRVSPEGQQERTNRFEKPREKLSAFEVYARRNGLGINQFGYDLFRQPPSTFAPSRNVPVGPGYLLGPGDELKIHIWGKVNDDYSVVIDRDGKVILPVFGVLHIAGLSFSEAAAFVKQEVSGYYKPSDVKIDISMGALRSIRVFVVGKARRPGGYTVSSFATLINALFAAGGPDKSGSMRDIQVKRAGKKIVDFDLYDFLLKGDTTGDVRLMDEDVIYIPPAGPLAGIAGDVKAPAIYEIDNEEMSAGRLIEMAGGLNDIAFKGRLQIDRVVDGRQVVVFEADLDGVKAKDLKVEPGDLVRVFSIVSGKQVVRLAGAVKRPGAYGAYAGLTLKGLISMAGGLQPYAYMRDAELTRVTPTDKGPKTVKIHIDLENALKDGAANDIELKENDYIFVRTVPEWNLYRMVAIRGEVRFPGTYTIEKGETIYSLIERAGGFTDKAYLKGAVFTRSSVRELQQKRLDESIDRLEKEIMGSSITSMGGALSPEDVKQNEAAMAQKKDLLAKMRAVRAMGRISISLAALDKFKGSPSDLTLENGDSLYVPETSSQVQVIGSVYNQTAFVYDKSSTVSGYLKKAGGLMKDADSDEVYVLKVDGTAVSMRESGWGVHWDSENNRFVSSGLMASRLDPGDTIVVPQKLEKVHWVKEAKDLTQILYQIAVTAGVLIVAF